MTAFQMRALLAGAALFSALALGCGDDAPDESRVDAGPPDMTRAGPDAGPMAMDDLGPTVGDAATVEDAATPTCDPDPCVNGTCADDLCVCDRGWEGPLCDSSIPPPAGGAWWWLDADAEGVFDAGADPDSVSTWRSRVEPFAVYNPADEAQPRVQATDSLANGRAMVAFDGVDDLLGGEGSTPEDLTRYTAFAVFTVSRGTAVELRDFVANPILRFAVDEGSAIRATVTDGSGGNAVTLGPATSTAGGVVVVAARIGATSVDFWVDGALVESRAVSDLFPTAGPRDWLGVYLGAQGPFSGPLTDVYGGSVGEVMVFPSALSGGEVDAVDGYLAAKWQ